MKTDINFNLLIFQSGGDQIMIVISKLSPTLNYLHRAVTHDSLMANNRICNANVMHSTWSHLKETNLVQMVFDWITSSRYS